MIRILILLALLGLAGSLSGCAKLLGNLRRDLDDTEPYSAPTIGGRWTERGQLDAERYDYVGHSERGPASVSGGQGYENGRSWISPDQADANRRDRFRGVDEGEDPQMMSMSNTPNLEPPTRRNYKNGGRATRADFVDETPNEGSLWGSDGQTNYYFTKNKVRGVGDIITVTAEADLIRDVALEVKRTLSPKEREYELAMAQERLRMAANGVPEQKDQVASSAAAPNRAPAAEGAGAGANSSANTAAKAEPKEVREATPADVDVAKSLEIKAGDTIMAEILERYPNGNYRIRGTKRILYKGGRARFVNLVGIARSADIGEDDLIASGKLYEYRLEAVQ